MPKLCLAAILLATASAAGAANIITNGDFETGDLTGWTNAGTYPTIPSYAFSAHANDGGATFSSNPTPLNPTGGSYFAVGDQGGSSTQILLQSFTVAGTSQTLGFDWFDNNHYPFSGSGLNYGVGDQAMRVDILTSGAAADDTGAGVVQNLLLNQTSGSWTSSLFNLNLAAGTYQLRFATTECCDFQNFGIDNVSLTEDVPEPAMLGLFGLGAFGIGLSRRRKA